MDNIMNRRTVLTGSAGFALALATSRVAAAQTMDQMSQSSFDTVMAFMGAMGSGDMKTMSNLMADDMVWQNEGDPNLPWIGTWESKEGIFGFLGEFSKNVEVKLWENLDAFASGDTVAVFGRMKLLTTKSGKETDEFTFALRAKVKDNQVILWNWFENSFAVSNAFHNK
jgi:ketosteroid isomerase-like protein